MRTTHAFQPAPARPSCILVASVLIASSSLAASAASPAVPVAPKAPKARSVAPAATVVPIQKRSFDYSGIGGTVYATGVGPVTVTMHAMPDFLSDQFYAYKTTVAARVGDGEVPLGINTRRSTTSLGQLPRGEIRLVARSESGEGDFESGAGSRNPDGFPRSRVKEVSPGVVEVYFETTRDEGTRNDRTEQHWYKDVKLTFSGAVTADPGMLVLLEKAKDPDPATRQAARQALQLASPALARAAGIATR